jgi:hypothetical protein
LGIYLHGCPLRWAVLFAPYWGGNNTERVLSVLWQICRTLYLFLADLWDLVTLPQGTRMQVYNSLSECRNVDL